jgi:hypothetical protein
LDNERSELEGRLVRIETLVCKMDEQTSEMNRFLHNHVESRISDCVTKWEVRTYVLIFTSVIVAVCTLMV